MGEAVDTFAELTRLHSETDDGTTLTFDRHTTTYADGQEIVEYEFAISDTLLPRQSIMLTAVQMKTLCHEMQYEWTEGGKK